MHLGAFPITATLSFGLFRLYGFLLVPVIDSCARHDLHCMAGPGDARRIEHRYRAMRR